MPGMMPLKIQRLPLWLAVAATASCLGAILGFAAVLDGYSHASHPLGWLGGRSLPGATGFNLLAYVLPGLLLAVVGWRLRNTLPTDAPVAARLGSWLVLLSALAFAAKGLLPLDLEELDAGASRGHAVAWMLWWMAFVPGTLLLWLGLRRLPGRRGWARTCLVAAIVFPGIALFLPLLLAPGHAQRLALLAWLGWWLLAAARRLSRGEA